MHGSPGICPLRFASCAYVLVVQRSDARTVDEVRRGQQHRLMAIDKKAALSEIDAVLGYKYEDKYTKNAQKSASVLACIRRYAPNGSAYILQSKPYAEMTHHATAGGYGVQGLVGILQALRADIDADRLRTFESIVVAEIFEDLLQQAQHLVDNSYRRAAAVLAGATLEEHLRKLAATNAISIVDANSHPKKASALNAELYKAAVYTKPEHAQVDAWQKIRNDAAHGEPNFETAHTDGDIGRMISGIRDFIVKHPS